MQSRRPCRYLFPAARALHFRPVARCALVILGLAFCAILSACLESKLPDGVVATVNDEPIHLRSLLALQDSRAAGPALQQQTVESLQKEYGPALGTLIIHTLASQELGRHNLGVSEAEVDAAISVVEKDYEENGGLAKYLAERSIDPEQWRVLVRNGLVMAKLEREVLLPALTIDLEQIREYHASHAAAFGMPEMLDVCMVAASEKEQVQKYCSAFPDKRHEAGNAAGLTVSCQQIDASNLPAPWHLESDRLAAGKCSQLRQQGGQQNGLWQAIAVIRRHKPQTMSLATAYPIIERKLQDARLQELFGQWLEKSLAKSRIRIAAQLKESVLAVPDGQKPDQTVIQEEDGVEEDASENRSNQNNYPGRR